MSDTKPLNLRQKLVQVYSMIDHVEKAGRNSKQNYNFVRAADVLRSVRDAFAQLGIYAETNYELLGTYDIKTNSGGVMHTATVKATIVLHDCDSPETMTITGLGDGADGGDKGIYKAQTGATKNALRNGALMPDEADPEADAAVDEYTDYRGTEAAKYSHPVSTTEMPDFQDARHEAPASNPTPRVQKPAEVPAPPPPPPVPVEKQNQGPAVPPERGDAWEGPEVSKLPTEPEMAAYRERFTQLANELSTHGKLTASKGLKLNTKLLVFFLQITKADAAKNVTVQGWDGFFQRVDAAVKNPEVGLLGLTKLINKANGIEPKQ
jgi:hypothetical protein